MSNNDNTSRPSYLDAPTAPAIASNVLASSRMPFWIGMIAFLALLLLVLLPFWLSAMTGRIVSIVPFDIPSEAGLLGRFWMGYAIHLMLFIVTIVSLVIAYRITTASGANPVQVIPPQDFPLLAPLIADGKAESVQLYVQLSSLGGFTGTFTQLGLTGLPLATIFMTILFSALALAEPDSFLDLAKLTLGAFIGSFVQRQVERRRETDDKEAAEAPQQEKK